MMNRTQVGTSLSGFLKVGAKFVFNQRSDMPGSIFLYAE